MQLVYNYSCKLIGCGGGFLQHFFWREVVPYIIEPSSYTASSSSQAWRLNPSALVFVNNDKLEWLNGEGPSGQPAVAVLHALKELECLVVGANGELLAYQIHLEMLESTYYTQTLFLNCSIPLLSWEKFPGVGYSIPVWSIWLKTAPIPILEASVWRINRCW